MPPRLLPAFSLLSGVLLAGFFSCSGDPPPPSGPPSVILLSIDTLRADHLGPRGEEPSLTPNLDRFAQESTTFSQAWSQANETCYSHSSVFTSRYPSELSTLGPSFRLPKDVPSLPEIVKAYGYTTGAAVGGAWLDPEFGLNRGFDQYDSPVEWGSFYHTVPKALSWLDSLDGSSPFFLFLHGYDVHQRYLKPTPFGYSDADEDYSGAARFVARAVSGTLFVTDDVLTPRFMALEQISRERVRFQTRGSGDTIARMARQAGQSVQKFTPKDAEQVRGIYAGAVRYADAWFGLLMADLEKRGILDRALIVVMADHGEGLGEKGVFNHRFHLGDTEVHVPLLMRLPRGEAGGRTLSTLVELTDILPTILDFVGAEPPAILRGHSLMPALRGGEAPPRDVAFSESAFRLLSARSTSGRLTLSGMSPENPALLETLPRLPLDGPSLESEGKPDKSALREAILSWRRSLVLAPLDEGEGTPDVLKDAMKTHGYWDAAP